MKYIDYHKMKEFYTIAEVCHLFEMDKKELRYYSKGPGSQAVQLHLQGAEK